MYVGIAVLLLVGNTIAQSLETGIRIVLTSEGPTFRQAGRVFAPSAGTVMPRVHIAIDRQLQKWIPYWLFAQKDMEALICNVHLIEGKTESGGGRLRISLKGENWEPFERTIEIKMPREGADAHAWEEMIHDAFDNARNFTTTDETLNKNLAGFKVGGKAKIVSRNLRASLETFQVDLAREKPAASGATVLCMSLKPVNTNIRYTSEISNMKGKVVLLDLLPKDSSYEMYCDGLDKPSSYLQRQIDEIYYAPRSKRTKKTITPAAQIPASKLR